METTENTTEAPIEQKPAVVLGDFGKGRYSTAMGELYKDSQRLLGFSDVQAHAAAARLGIDVGRQNSGQAKLKFGKKVNSEGLRTIKEIVSLKVPNSWAFSIAVICNGLDELRKQGLEVNDCSVDKNLLEFVNIGASRLSE